MIHPVESSTHVKTNGFCCFTEHALDFSSVTTECTKLFHSKIRIVIFFFLFEENFLWSKQSSHLLTVNQSPVSVSVVTGTYKRRKTRCKSHSTLAFDVNTIHETCHLSVCSPRDERILSYTTISKALLNHEKKVKIIHTMISVHRFQFLRTIRV